MTREEIVDSMSLQDAIQVFKDTNTYGTMDIAKSVILKALEERDVLIDKIRAEIEHDMQEAPYMYDDEHLDELYSYQEGLEDALHIIDKYKAESEE